MAVAAAAAVAACDLGAMGTAPPPSGTGGGAGSGGAMAGAGAGGAAGGPVAPLPDPTATPSFVPQPEFAGPCARASGAIDVNLGNSPEGFVRAAFCQVSGSEPPPDVVTRWADQLRTVEYVRRIDVVRSLCADAGRPCAFNYGDPWQADLPLSPVCTRKGARDVGSVLMFFSDCPNGVNCGMDWANTHPHGMRAEHPLFAFDPAPANYYNPKNAGYWYRQLLDARWAGLQFFLVNTYGPDLGGTPDRIAMLAQALVKAGPGGVQVGLFDDTWAWGQTSSPPAFQSKPDFSSPDAAAQLIYTAKWKPFYSRIDKAYWYAVGDRPFLYFYNAGTLGPLNVSAAVVSRLKQLFAQDFGVMPFVVVDNAYFQDPAMTGVADARFTWDTLRTGIKSRSTMNGFILDHTMVKWDTVGRDKPGSIATAGDRVIKGTSILADRLASSADANALVIATWNDIGEGTGIERNYDYYFGGAWQPPTAFMSLIRAGQCSD
ncbi:MAG TPA: DUF5010 domain-containing protein [Polyangia bacterium]|nr:DUF5010 domain-containing protein [Polyangia bacterium]